MAFTPFELEQWQSRYEQTVAYNLADSGCHPVALGELLGDDFEQLQALLDLDLFYPPVGGTDALRSSIADWHGADAGDVLVTVGAAEANAITVASLVEPGDHVVVMEPGYRQVRGSALNAGARVDAFPLDPERGWRPDLDALDRVVRPGTKLIAVTNPNNPVGTILTDAEIDAIVRAADRVGAWILADEVYRGTERLTDAVTPTFWGRGDRIVCVGSLSKAFGLPGLRLGWLVGPPGLVEAAWRRHEYATIAASRLSMHLGEVALTPEVTERLLKRNRTLIRAGYDRLEGWIGASGRLLSIVPPVATALAFVRYHLPDSSLALADRLRAEAGVLVAPGVQFGVENHLRITHGLEPDYFDAALAGITKVLADGGR